MSAFITIIGRLGADPEIKSSEKGARCNVRVAVNQGKDSTGWYSATIFGARGEALYNTDLRKGSFIAISGKLVVNEKDGKTYLNIQGADWTFCAGRSSEPSAGRVFADEPDQGFPADAIPF